MMLELHCAHPIYTKELIKELVNKFGDKEKTLITLLTKKLSGELSVTILILFYRKNLH